MDHRLKFMASSASHWLSNYASKGLRKGGFPLVFANTWMHAHMCVCLFNAMSGPFELNGYNSSTKWQASTDGDEVITFSLDA